MVSSPPPPLLYFCSLFVTSTPTAILKERFNSDKQDANEAKIDRAKQLAERSRMRKEGMDKLEAMLIQHDLAEAEKQLASLERGKEVTPFLSDFLISYTCC